MDPTNYFLVILGGFGAVWGYRHFSKQQDKKISEFEYAAFSALWGIPTCLAFLFAAKYIPNLLNGLDIVPMVGTPIVFGAGVFSGWIAVLIRRRHDKHRVEGE